MEQRWTIARMPHMFSLSLSFFMLFVNNFGTHLADLLDRLILVYNAVDHSF
jgi:hypothetical protein